MDCKVIVAGGNHCWYRVTSWCYWRRPRSSRNVRMGGVAVSSQTLFEKIGDRVRSRPSPMPTAVIPPEWSDKLEYG